MSVNGVTRRQMLEEAKLRGSSGARKSPGPGADPPAADKHDNLHFTFVNAYRPL